MTYLSPPAILVASLLAALSIAYSLLTCSWERARRVLTESALPALCPNLLSTWRFAAAVSLPVPLAAAVIAVTAVAEWPARNIAGQATPYRYVYSTSGAVFAAAAAHQCAKIPLPDGLAMAPAALSYIIIGFLPVVLAQLAVGERGIRRYLGWDSHRLEVYTVLIGLVEVLLLRTHLDMMVWLSLPATIFLQRRTVRSDLRAAEDPNTKPMSEQAWLLVAREVIRACPVGAIMRINTADPAAVSYLARVKAGCDAIGMTGKSGLAVLLTQCPGENADALADRMRSILHRDGVAAQVSVAAKPRDGHSLDDLLAVSEAELIARVAATRSARLDIPEA